jgi:hypothetical protein
MEQKPPPLLRGGEALLKGADILGNAELPIAPLALGTHWSMRLLSRMSHGEVVDSDAEMSSLNRYPTYGSVSR